MKDSIKNNVITITKCDWMTGPGSIIYNESFEIKIVAVDKDKKYFTVIFGNDLIKFYNRNLLASDGKYYGKTFADIKADVANYRKTNSKIFTDYLPITASIVKGRALRLSKFPSFDNTSNVKEGI